jgi:hypothetical protein
MGLHDKALSDAKRMIKSDNQDERVRQLALNFWYLSSKTAGLLGLSGH